MGHSNNASQQQQLYVAWMNRTVWPMSIREALKDLRQDLLFCASLQRQILEGGRINLRRLRRAKVVPEASDPITPAPTKGRGKGSASTKGKGTGGGGKGRAGAGAGRPKKRARKGEEEDDDEEDDDEDEGEGATSREVSFDKDKKPRPRARPRPTLPSSSSSSAQRGARAGLKRKAAPSQQGGRGRGRGKGKGRRGGGGAGDSSASTEDEDEDEDEEEGEEEEDDEEIDIDAMRFKGKRERNAFLKAEGEKSRRRADQRAERARGVLVADPSLLPPLPFLPFSSAPALTAGAGRGRDTSTGRGKGKGGGGGVDGGSEAGAQLWSLCSGLALGLPLCARSNGLPPPSPSPSHPTPAPVSKEGGGEEGGEEERQREGRERAHEAAVRQHAPPPPSSSSSSSSSSSARPEAGAGAGAEEDTLQSASGLGPCVLEAVTRRPRPPPSSLSLPAAPAPTRAPAAATALDAGAGAGLDAPPLELYRAAQHAAVTPARMVYLFSAASGGALDACLGLAEAGAKAEAGAEAGAGAGAGAGMGMGMGGARTAAAAACLNALLLAPSLHPSLLSALCPSSSSSPSMKGPGKAGGGRSKKAKISPSTSLGPQKCATWVSAATILRALSLRAQAIVSAAQLPSSSLSTDTSPSPSPNDPLPSDVEALLGLKACLDVVVAAATAEECRGAELMCAAEPGPMSDVAAALVFYSAGVLRSLASLLSSSAGAGVGAAERGGEEQLLPSACAALDGCLSSSALLLAALATRRPAVFVGQASRRAMLVHGALAPDALALGMHFCSGPQPLLRTARRELVLAALDTGAKTPPDLRAFATAALGCVAFRAAARPRPGQGQDEEEEEEEEEKEALQPPLPRGVERLLAFLSS